MEKKATECAEERRREEQQRQHEAGQASYVLIAPNIQSIASISATIATPNNNHHQNVYTPSQQAAAVVEILQWNKGHTVTPTVFSIGNKNGCNGAYEHSGGTNSTEDRRTAERANRRGLFNKDWHKDARVNSQRNNGRNNRDLSHFKRK